MGRPKKSAASIEAEYEGQAAKDMIAISDEPMRRAKEYIEQKEGEAAKLVELRAYIHRMAGRVEAADFMVKIGTGANLLWLKEVKDGGLYKELPEVGTWENFCNIVGIGRRWADEQLQNLETFGEEFSARGASLGLRPTDFRKLRKGITDGRAQVSDGSVVIEGEIIPLDAAHKDDLQDALDGINDKLERLQADMDSERAVHEKLVAAKEDVIKKQERHIRKVEKAAEGKGLTAVEESFLEDLRERRTTIDGYLALLAPPATALEDEDERPTPRMVAEYVNLHEYIARQAALQLAEVVERYGSPETDPDEAWQPGMGYGKAEA